MSATSSSLPIRARKRPDLIVRIRQYQQRDYYLVKDPVGLKYARLHEEEYAILNMLDGSASIDTITQAWELQFRPARLSSMQLQAFLGTLFDSGLILSDSPNQGGELWRRSNREWWKKVAEKLTSIFAIRWRGFDPDALLNVLNRFAWAAFTWPAFIFVLLVATSALSLVVVQWQEFTLRLPTFYQFFGPANWIHLGLAIGVVKILHEFGHGLACKRFGGECREIGFMLLVFSPALYCDVSDSWMLQNKWKRIAIGGAGIYVEAFLASVATFLWWFSNEATLLNQLCLQVMFVCSVSTLVFNGNPLLRFDGYYILADYLEIPNLRSKADQALSTWLTWLCLGIEEPADPFSPHRNQLWLALFTVASSIYKWVIVISILWFLNNILEPYGLQSVGRIIAGIGMAGMIVSPAYRMYKYLSTPGRLRDVKRFHLLATSVAGVLLLFGVFMPFPCYVRTAAEIQPRNAATLYVEHPGRLRTLFVGIGQSVSEGETIGNLESLELEQEIEKLKSQRRVEQSSRAFLLKLKHEDPQAGLKIAEVDSVIASMTEAIADKEKQQARLMITAPVDGVVYPVARKPAGKSEIELDQWNGRLLDRNNQNAAVSAGDQLCRIGDPSKMDAVLVVDQADVDLVAIGQPAWIQLESCPGELLKTSLEIVSPNKMQAVSPSLSVQSGGTLQTNTRPDGVTEPVASSYAARAELQDPPANLQIGLRGQAKIYIGNRSLAWRGYRWLCSTFSFHL